MLPLNTLQFKVFSSTRFLQEEADDLVDERFIPKTSESPAPLTSEEVTQDPAYGWYRKNMLFAKNAKGEPIEWCDSNLSIEKSIELEAILKNHLPFYKFAQAQGSLSSIENTVIQLFSSDECMLFYVALATEDNRAENTRNDSRYFKKLALDKIRETSILLNQTLVDALKKLPNFEGTIYRGTQLQRDKISIWYKKGKISFERLPSSYTKSKEIARQFALGNYQKMTLKKGEIPAIIVMKSQTGKDIAPYCIQALEAEVCYPPCQFQRSLGWSIQVWDEKEFAFIYVEEAFLQKPKNLIELN